MSEFERGRRRLCVTTRSFTRQPGSGRRERGWPGRTDCCSTPSRTSPQVGDDLAVLGNCPGGDGQVQWNMQVISHLVDHGDDPQRAVSLPRVTVFPGSDADTLGSP